MPATRMCGGVRLQLLARLLLCAVPVAPLFSPSLSSCGVIPCDDIPCDAMTRHDKNGHLSFPLTISPQTLQGEDEDDDVIIDRGNAVSLICPITSATFKDPVRSKVRSARPARSTAKCLGQHNSLPRHIVGCYFCAES